MLPSAIEAMTAGFHVVGNAASVHSAGRTARRHVEESRELIAEAFGARPSEVIFTAGGTESDNLAIKGIFWARRDEVPQRTRLLVGATEHHAVLDAAEWLVRYHGATITWVPVTDEGIVTPAALEAAINENPDDVALATVMWANNEVGTINPIRELAAVARSAGIPLHSDAVQAAGPLGCDFAASGLSAMTITAHKFGGPHGVGALFLRRDVACQPILHGGGHERDVRSGTPDNAAILAMAAAVKTVVRDRDETTTTMRRLRQRLITGINELNVDAVINGGRDAQLPNIVNVTFPGCEGDSLLMLMDANQIECSTGSACTAGVARASHVLIAMGISPSIARGTLRFSFGHTSTDHDVDHVLETLPQIVERAKSAGLASAAAGERNV
ncbi:cysteine desulfurase [Hoyosella rhizosphaerae]|uniref:Cysteine desulfurase n=2 Tax=Hoyosella rhizosphaerae TaxID=1755582 RepID=A0A916TYS6_9ACTN|nr:cysteine desulfurase [Hoyosella rhizosphaerae]